MTNEDEKRAAAREAARRVEEGMLLGLGTGTTVAHFLPALAERRLDVVCVATSPATEKAARDLGLTVRGFRSGSKVTRLDLAVDGADQVAPDGWCVKGGGGAHTREKIVAAAAERFVVIVSSDKLVAELAPPIPLELHDFGFDAMASALGDVRRRDAALTPDGGVLADWWPSEGSLADPVGASARLSNSPGVVEHGLFPPEMVHEVIVGTSEGGTRSFRPARGTDDDSRRR